MKEEKRWKKPRKQVVLERQKANQSTSMSGCWAKLWHPHGFKTLRLLTARTCRFRTVHPWQALRQLMKGGSYKLAGPGYKIDTGCKSCICRLEPNRTGRLADWLKICKMRIAWSSIDLLMTPARRCAATQEFDRSLDTTHSLSFAENWWKLYIYI